MHNSYFFQLGPMSVGIDFIALKISHLIPYWLKKNNA